MRVAYRHLLAIALTFSVPLLCHASATERTESVLVAFDAEVQFTAPDGSTVRTTTGHYRVDTNAAQLRLTNGDTGEHTLLQAQALTHNERLGSPIALLIPRSDGSQHLAYLFPDGKGLVAVGTTATVRERGLLSATLTSDEVKLYVALKLEQAAKAPAATGSKQKPHEDAVTSLIELLRRQPGGAEMIAQAERAGAVLPAARSEKRGDRTAVSNPFSVELTIADPRRSGASLSIGTTEPGATITAKIPKSGWYLVSLRVTARSTPLHTSLSAARVLKTIVSGKTGRSTPVVIRSWQQTLQPGEEQTLPALVELKPGDYELVWLFTSGSADILEARLLSL